LRLELGIAVFFPSRMICGHDATPALKSTAR
jgi:hypothetical protein